MEHIPAPAVRLLWDAMEERSWAELHRVAHAEEDEQGNDRIDPAPLSDIIRVARAQERDNAEFPGSFSGLCDALDHMAETMPHETRS